MAARRLLIVTYYYPPLESTGSNRWGAMVRHLRRLGHEVTVVTAARVAGDPDVVTTADLRSLEPLRRALGRPSLAGRAEGEPIDMPAPAVFTRVAVPDMFALSWAPFALRAVRRLLHSLSFDCLITSSPPESTHLVGLALGARRPPWLVDLRDGWSFEPYRDPFPTAAQRDLDRRLERAVMRTADGHVAVTRPIAADLRSRFGADAGWVPNGHDPDDPDLEIPQRPDATAAHARSAVTLVHTGRLSRVRGRDPRALFDALARLRERDPDLAARLRVTLVGPVDEPEVRALKELGVGDLVEQAGPLPRAAALAAQRAADVLLLVTSAGGSEATGKIYEYLAAGPPILALAGDGEAARIVQETGAGTVVAPDDADAIAGGLARAARGELAQRRDEAAIARYVYPEPARVLAERADAAISAAERRRRR